MRARWRWLAILAGVGIGIAIAAAGAWHDLSAARTDLTEARLSLAKTVDDPSSMRTTEGRRRARGDTDNALLRVAAARRKLTASPFISSVRFIPGLSAQRSGLLALVDDSRMGALAGRRLLVKADGLADRTRVADGAVPLAALGELEAGVRDAGEQLRILVRPSAGLFGSLHDARERFDQIAGDASRRLLQAADGLGAARTFLGLDGNRQYLVALQNNAEMRDQGMVLSYAVMDVAAGRLAFKHSGPISELALQRPTNTVVPAGTQAVFGSTLPTKLWQSVNATADFAWSGQAMSDMYRQATGQTVDGVIAIDVVSLAQLLRTVGPVPVQGVTEPLTAENATRVLLHDLYQHPYGSTAGVQREDKVQAGATQAVIERLSRGNFDAVTLGQEMGDAAASGRLKLWSRVPAEEERFERVGLGGGPGVTDAGHTFHLAVENRTATKLDYYIHPAIDQRIELTPAGAAVIRTTITVQNDSPPGAPPSVQVGPDGEVTSRPGDYIASILWWGPKGSSQQDAATESGLQLTNSLGRIGAGQRVQIVVTTVLRNAVQDGRLEFRFVPQPRLEPVELNVTLVAPGWRVEGERAKHIKWGQVAGVAWSVAR